MSEPMGASKRVAKQVAGHYDEQYTAKLIDKQFLPLVEAAEEVEEKLDIVESIKEFGPHARKRAVALTELYVACFKLRSTLERVKNG
jgi:hypothetical protein